MMLRQMLVSSYQESYEYDEYGQSLKVKVWDDNGDSSIITVHPDEVHSSARTIIEAIKRYYN